MVDFAPGVFPMFCSTPRERHSEKERREEGPRGEWAACRGEAHCQYSQRFERHTVVFSRPIDGPPQISPLLSDEALLGRFSVSY
jgi:hypothetical protein